MRKVMVIIGCAVGGATVLLGILCAGLLGGDYVWGRRTVEMEAVKEKYANHASTIRAFDERITVYGTNGEFTEGTCWQCYNFDLDGLCYNFSFQCNIYGKESFELELSQATQGELDTSRMSLFIALCVCFSKENFSEDFLLEKCEEALRTGNGRISKDYAFTLDEYGGLYFRGLPR